jgi:chloramphenicol O-acetyltransferase type A
MHEIDLSTWPRRRHFELFSTFNHPHFGLCADVDLSVFLPRMRQCGVPFTVAFVYAIARAANAVPEFRHRIRSGKVVEHDLVSPSFTVLAGDDLFGFCTISYCEAFLEFAQRARTAISRAQEHICLAIDPERDDLLFMTALPWVAFTSFAHPMPLHPADSIPRFAWGKYHEEAQRTKIPLSVQGHHALMDGIHMARFYAKLEEHLRNPDFLEAAGA